MSNFHFDAKIINRSDRSATGAVSYMAGKNLYDSYRSKMCYKKRNDIEFLKVFLPRNAPAEFNDIQVLCNKIDEAERRSDARTARLFVGSLPNEISDQVRIEIVEEFITKHFTANGLGAIAAIHSGVNERTPLNNNPHAHIIVTTRAIGAGGFSKTKYRDLDKPNRILEWRKSWADIQNKAYERNNLAIRLSHESFEKQGIEREPIKHLAFGDWQRELRGECTKIGNENRKIKKRNAERELQVKLQRERALELYR